MKTVLISQKDLNGTRSGVPRLVQSELNFFDKHQIKAFAISERIHSSFLSTKNIQFYKTLRWPISGLYRRNFYMKQVKKAAKKIKPDLVIGHGDIVEQDICFIHNCVHLAFEKIHNQTIPTDHEMAIIHGKILTERKFKALICNSIMMKEDLIKRFNLPADNIFVHYPQLNDDIFGKTKENIREEFDIDNETIVIGLITSGNFKKRNVRLLLDTVKDLESKQKIHIIITGKDKSSPFQEIVNDSRHKITFLPTTDRVERYYNTIDIFVLPAHIEEFGMSVLEAMACEKPVIISKMVGASEIIEDESRDFILDDLTKRELSTKLLTLIESPELRKKLGTINKKTAFKFCNKNQDDNFKKILEFVGFTV